jgi:uncharacterized protein (TIGR02001 family)
VSVFSDDRFRGYSLSYNRPVAIADLSYDAPDGLYAALTGSAVATRHDGVQPLGLQLNGGYAKKLSANVSLDFGMTHSEYSRYSSSGPAKSYTEAYAGLSGKFLSGRVYLSPDYVRSGDWSLYGELDGHIPAEGKWRLTAHAGLLVPFRTRVGYESYHPEFDWRVGVARDFGPVTASVSATGTRRREETYPYRMRPTRALVFGLTYAL